MYLFSFAGEEALNEYLKTKVVTVEYWTSELFYLLWNAEMDVLIFVIIWYFISLLGTFKKAKTEICSANSGSSNDSLDIQWSLIFFDLLLTRGKKLGPRQC